MGVELIREEFLVEASRGGRKMLCDIRYPSTAQAKPAIVFVHGFKGFKDWGGWNQIMDQLAQAGFVVMKGNLSHNGTTPEQPLDFADLEAFGRNTFTQEKSDIQDWIHALVQGDCPVPASELDPSRIGIIGHSRGGALTILAAAQNPHVSGVATWAAVADLSSRYPESSRKPWQQEGVRYIPNARTGQQMPLYYTLMQDLIDHPEALSVPLHTERLTVPLLIVHGDADPTVSVEDAEAIRIQKPDAEKVIIAGADHVFQMRHPMQQTQLPAEAQQVVAATLTFFQKCL